MALAMSAPFEGMAQSFPHKPIRLIVPLSAGGTGDTLARTVGEAMSRELGQPVVIENKPGAGGLVGTEMAAAAPADGYTLLVVSPAHVINPLLHADKKTYDPLKGFEPITVMANTHQMIVAHPSVPVKNVRELIALAKARPGEVSYASSGNFLYLSGALFTSMAKISMLHVPFKGGAQAMPSVMAGEVATSFATIVSSLPLVKEGRLRGIAVTSAKRFPSALEYPTVAESGLPGYEAVAWYGLFAPAGTPRDIVQKINADVVAIVQAPDVRELFLAQGAEAYALTPEAFARLVQEDVGKWAKVVKASGAKAD
jgi:tripartite-type tricarboxylate transporter receptor subunit TctC